MPPYLTFACRGFSLLVPLVAVFAYVFLVKGAGGVDPNKTNALIRDCVEAERAAGRDGRACIGRIATPCKQDPDNVHKEDQMECDEREFTMWDLLMDAEFEALQATLDDTGAKVKLQETQDLWRAYHKADCRLPYALFERPRAQALGPACTIALTAARAIELRTWREALAAEK